MAAAQDRWEMITLHIGGTFGPPCSSNGQGFVPLSMKYIRGGLFFPACPPMGFPTNDIRDVAALHSLAMVTSRSFKPSKRYIGTCEYTKFKVLCDGMKKDRRTRKILLPYFEFPSFIKPVFRLAMPTLGFDSSLVNRSWGCVCCGVRSLWRAGTSRRRG